jgi:tetratricopeptide (TPR) repeat protein
MFRWWLRTTEIIGILWGILTDIVTRAFFFPLDCLFCVYDVFAVNIRKMGWLGRECHNEQGCCSAPRRYTNKWIFRFFICGNFHPVSGLPFWSCEAEEEGRVRVFRGLLALAIVLMGTLVLSFALFGEWWIPEQDNEGPETAGEQAKSWASRGHRRFAAQDYNAAMGFYRRALEEFPGMPKVNYRAGVSAEKKIGIHAALPYYEKAALAEEPVPQAAEKLAAYCYERGRLLQAGEWARRGLEAGSDAPALHAIMAESHLVLPDKAASARHIERAVELGSEEWIVRLARARILLEDNDIETARALLEVVAEERDTVPASLGLCRSLIRQKNGNAAEACGVLENYVTQYRVSRYLRIHLMETLFSAGSRQEALAEFRRFLQEGTLRNRQKLALARILHRHAEPDRALDLLLDLCDTESSRTFVPANLLAGRIYLEAGLLLRAERHAEQILGQNPHGLDALLLKGRVAIRGGRHREARRLFDRGLEENPDNAPMLYRTGAICLALGQRDEATTKLHRACQLSPENGRYRYVHGIALIGVGHDEEAARQLERAAELLDDGYLALTRLGELKQAQGKLDRAASLFERAILENPRRATRASHCLAHLLLNNGEQLPLALALAYSAQANTCSAPPGPAKGPSSSPGGRGATGPLGASLDDTVAVLIPESQIMERLAASATDGTDILHRAAERNWGQTTDEFSDELLRVLTRPERTRAASTR